MRLCPTVAAARATTGLITVREDYLIPSRGKEAL
jgi:hypothetical protein